MPTAPPGGVEAEASGGSVQGVVEAEPEPESLGSSEDQRQRRWNSELGIWEGAAAAAATDFELPPGASVCVSV